MRIRDKTPTRRAEFTPVQRQLLGLLDDIDGDHAWGHEPARVPLYQLLHRTRQLQAELRRVAGRLAAARGPCGWSATDDAGSDSYNLDLSRRRAQAVQQALARMLPGAGARFQVQAKGETEPAVQGSSAEARRRNRRVEVSFEQVVASPPAATAPPTTQPAQPATGQPLGGAQGTGEFAGVTLEVLGARRVGADMAAVMVRLTNNGSGEPHLTRVPAGDLPGFEGMHYFMGEFFWVFASDASPNRYYAVRTVGGIPYRLCVCSLIHFTVARDTLPPGGQVRLFALLAAPPDTPTISLQAPGFGGPIRNVPLT